MRGRFKRFGDQPMNLGNIPTRSPDVRLVVKRSDEHFMEMRDRPEPSPLRAEPIQAARGPPMNVVTVLARRPALECRCVFPGELAIFLDHPDSSPLCSAVPEAGKLPMSLENALARHLAQRCQYKLLGDPTSPRRWTNRTRCAPRPTKILKPLHREPPQIRIELCNGTTVAKVDRNCSNHPFITTTSEQTTPTCSDWPPPRHDISSI